MTFVIFFTCSLPSFNDMSKHSLVLWPLLLLLSVVVFFFCFVFLFFCLGFVFFWGGVIMFFLKKIFCSFFDGKSVMSALFTYYYVCMFV